MKNKSKNQTDTSLVLAAIFIAAFLAFYGLKINGHFDFTGSSNIREIYATMDQENVMAMIDGDENTEWKNAPIWTEPVASPGDNITIEFDGLEKIKGIRMSGRMPDCLRFLYASDDDWHDIDVAKASDGEYLFAEPINTDTLRIEVADGGDDYRWRVSELYVL